MKSSAALRKIVRLAYGRAARKSQSCCSGSSCCGHASGKAVEGELGLSCGDPVAFSKIKKGMTVVDLGSGAGKDVFIAAGIAGPGGRAIGVDMTAGMLRLARRNLEKFTARTGLANAEFRKGIIEKLPVENGEADLIISNCVINLSPDKPAVFREAFRALKPGGKLVVSDIALNRALPPRLKKDAGLYAACVAGALLREDYIGAIRQAGFVKIKTLSDKLYSAGAAGLDPITSRTGKALEGAASSLTIEAVKPGRRK
ncbi:MAG: methyltransferase domain-containing protein [Elusimicrobiales bacterium]